jgi:Spy/CpxP family protein refolding chaperone
MTLSRLLSALVLVAGIASVDTRASQAQTPFIWWRSDEVKRQLELTADQVARINSIFDSTRPELRDEMDELRVYEAKLQKLLEAGTDEATLVRQIDRLETARANLNKTRSLMFMRMRLVLSPKQRKRLKAVDERWKLEPQEPGSRPIVR